MSGYTQLRLIATARDSSAHIVLRKPVAPQTLFDRILWVARVGRPFMETRILVRPRNHDIERPDGIPTRNRSAHGQGSLRSP